jgi:hypothetical protein
MEGGGSVGGQRGRGIRRGGQVEVRGHVVAVAASMNIVEAPPGYALVDAELVRYFRCKYIYLHTVHTVHTYIHTYVYVYTHIRYVLIEAKIYQHTEWIGESDRLGIHTYIQTHTYTHLPNT